MRLIPLRLLRLLRKNGDMYVSTIHGQRIGKGTTTSSRYRVKIEYGFIGMVITRGFLNYQNLTRRLTIT